MSNKEIQKQADLNCRRKIRLALRQAVTEGLMEIVGFDQEGQLLYRLTQKGIAEVEAMGEPSRS